MPPVKKKIMKIVIAPDSYKETLAASQVARAIKKGFESILPQASYEIMPIGDGGEGTMIAIQESIKGTWATVDVEGPFGEAISYPYLVKGTSALIETADLVGLSLVPQEKRNPLLISTKGLGQVLAHLLGIGMKDIYIGVGGTACNDGGIGMATALGYSFYHHEKLLENPMGKDLGKVTSFVKEKNGVSFDQTRVHILTDVTNPLCGPQGATKIFAPQKGLDLSKLEEVDQAMQSFYQLVNPELVHLEGGGAGGGLGAALVAFAKGEIASGIDTCLDLIDFDRRVKDASLVIVGEGKMDAQSLAGKAPIGVARRVKGGVPVVAICGSLGGDLPDLTSYGIAATFSALQRLMNWQELQQTSFEQLVESSKNIARLLNLNL